MAALVGGSYITTTRRDHAADTADDFSRDKRKIRPRVQPYVSISSLQQPECAGADASSCHRACRRRSASARASQAHKPRQGLDRHRTNGVQDSNGSTVGAGGDMATTPKRGPEYDLMMGSVCDEHYEHGPLVCCPFRVSKRHRRRRNRSARSSLALQRPFDASSGLNPREVFATPWHKEKKPLCSHVGRVLWREAERWDSLNDTRLRSGRLFITTPLRVACWVLG